MELSARLYNCACCNQQVILCSHCDRGNRYCFDGCSEAARRESLRDAGRSYQDSNQGRLKHAQRQARYRARQASVDSAPPPPSEKVTHQGSDQDTPSASIETDEQRGEDDGFDSLYRCHCCGRAVDPYLRPGYLRYQRATSPDSSPFQHQA